ncbi:hypothetical protein BH09BAC1_BH09BAC1_03330 [soil metagenome]
MQISPTMDEMLSQFLGANMTLTKEEAAFIAECMPVPVLARKLLPQE